jgi:hypothetical protein
MAGAQISVNKARFLHMQGFATRGGDLVAIQFAIIR